MFEILIFILSSPLIWRVFSIWDHPVLGDCYALFCTVSLIDREGWQKNGRCVLFLFHFTRILHFPLFFFSFFSLHASKVHPTCFPHLVLSEKQCFSKASTLGLIITQGMECKRKNHPWSMAGTSMQTSRG